MNWKTAMIACTMSFAFTCIPQRVAHAEAIKHVHTEKKVVAITFDDGPSATFTPKILNVLRENEAKATFFVIGSRIEKFPELINEEAQEDHEVANHSFQHQIMTGLSEQRIYDEITHTQQALKDAIGNEQPLMFRPPRGKVNKTILHIAEQNHYTIVMWSVDSGDWANPGVHKIVKGVLSKVKNGDIILFHDQGGDRTQTVEALQQILPVLRARGYDFVTVSDLMTEKVQ